MTVAFNAASAGAYELAIGRWSRMLARRFVDWLAPIETGALLDIGCGTGHVAHELAAHSPQAQVSGIEPMPALLEAARSRAHPRCTFGAGDAMDLPLPAQAFDLVVSHLVLNFLADPAGAAREMHRVSHVGARVAAAVWDIEDGFPAMRLLWSEAAAAAPAMQAVYARWRIQPLAQPGALAQLWRDAGLTALRQGSIHTVMHFESFDDFWLPFAQGGQAFGLALAQLDHTTAARVEQRVRAVYGVAAHDARLSLPVRALAVVGRRPA